MDTFQNFEGKLEKKSPKKTISVRGTRSELTQNNTITEQEQNFVEGGWLLYSNWCFSH